MQVISPFLLLLVLPGASANTHPRTDLFTGYSSQHCYRRVLMGVTSKEVIERLKQSGRHRFTERQLTDFRCRQLLPALQRFKQPGSRKPLYLWDEGVIAQAAYLHDLLQWDRQYDRLYIPLWLEEYDISLRAVRRLTLRFIDRHLTQLTKGKTDAEEILDHVSTLIYKDLCHAGSTLPKDRDYSVAWRRGLGGTG